LALIFLDDETDSAVTVTPDRYVHVANEFLYPKLRRRDIDLATARFQQHGGTALPARQSKNTLRIVFEHRILSRYGDISWPGRSPDMSACNFFLWGYMKIEVFQHALQTYVTSNREFRMRSMPSHRPWYFT
jgi:hypothetical protein